MIDLFILSLGTITFTIAMLSHIFIWRAIRPANDLAWLALIFTVFPLVIYPLLFFISYPVFTVIFGFLWHFTLSAAYIASYPLFQARCPTFTIILAIDSSTGGMTFESIKNLFNEDILFNERIKDLLDEGLLRSENNKFMVSSKGALLSSLFSLYRSVLGLPLGEG